MLCASDIAVDTEGASLPNSYSIMAHFWNSMEFVRNFNRIEYNFWPKKINEDISCPTNYLEKKGDSCIF